MEVGQQTGQDMPERERGSWWLQGGVWGQGVTHSGGSTDRRLRNGCRRPAPRAGEGCHKEWLGSARRPPPPQHPTQHRSPEADPRGPLLDPQHLQSGRPPLLPHLPHSTVVV